MVVNSFFLVWHLNLILSLFADQVVFTFRSLIYSNYLEQYRVGNWWSFVMGAGENTMDIKVDRLPGEAKEILKSLASEWEDVLDVNELQVIQLKGAMTNQVFQIKWPTKTVSRKVLARIYGEGVAVFFDRDDEIRTFEFMSKHGQGPRLLGRFPNGRIEEFIHARVF